MCGLQATVIETESRELIMEANAIIHGELEN